MKRIVNNGKLPTTQKEIEAFYARKFNITSFLC